MKRPAVFFDRDNTLIACDGYLGDPEQVVLVDGAADAIARVRAMGYAAVVFSNQSGVARGMFPEEAVHAVNHRLDELLHEDDPRAVIDRHDFCPYHPTAAVDRYRVDSDLRKPKPGMIYQAERVLNLDLAESWVIGDAPRDIAAGHAAGLRTVLVKIAGLPPSPATKEGAGVEPDFVATSLAEAVDLVRAHRDRPAAAVPEVSSAVDPATDGGAAEGGAADGPRTVLEPESAAVRDAAADEDFAVSPTAVATADPSPVDAAATPKPEAADADPQPAASATPSDIPAAPAPTDSEPDGTSTIAPPPPQPAGAVATEFAAVATDDSTAEADDDVTLARHVAEGTAPEPPAEPVAVAADGTVHAAGDDDGTRSEPPPSAALPPAPEPADAWTSAGTASLPAAAGRPAAGPVPARQAAAATTATTATTTRGGEPTTRTNSASPSTAGRLGTANAAGAVTNAGATPAPRPPAAAAGKPVQGGFVVKPAQGSMTWGERMRLAKQGGMPGAARGPAEPVSADADAPAAATEADAGGTAAAEDRTRADPGIPTPSVKDVASTAARAFAAPAAVEARPDHPASVAPAAPMTASPDPMPLAAETRLGEPAAADTGTEASEPAVSATPAVPAADPRRGWRREDEDAAPPPQEAELMDDAPPAPEAAAAPMDAEEAVAPAAAEPAPAPAARRRAARGPAAARAADAEPATAGDLARVEDLLAQILAELRRRDDLSAIDFSVSKLMAGITQVLALAALTYAYLYKDSQWLLPALLVALTLQTLTISLLIMGRQR